LENELHENEQVSGNEVVPVTRSDPLRIAKMNKKNRWQLSIENAGLPLSFSLQDANRINDT
jgi:hypothetical protein